jgi:hypothetical protein
MLGEHVCEREIAHWHYTLPFIVNGIAEDGVCAVAT